MYDSGVKDRPRVPEQDSPAFRGRPDVVASQTTEYSRFVRIAKILLPSTAAGLFLVIVLYSALHNTVSDIGITFEGLRNPGGQLEMANPTLTYTDDANRAYHVKASRAVQAGSRDLWQLQTIQGRMTPPEGRGYRLTAESGHLDAAKKLLDLKGSVLVVSDEGYTFEAQSAHVDMNDNRVTSEEPVRANGGVTTIVSDRFQMWDKGAKLRFEGRVRFVSESAPRTAPPDDTSETP